MIKTTIFESKEPGPTFLALGAIHGNETCGTVALARLITEIENGIVELKKGRLVLAPICNKKAYIQHVRFVEENLNRIIAHHPSPATDEHAFANEVVKLIDDSDIVLDLHSYASGTKPFLFLDNDTPAVRAYATATGIPDWVTGWNDVYSDKPELNGGDTMSYAMQQGKTGLLIECGHHEDPASALVGYQSVRASLAFFGMTDPYARTTPILPRVHRMATILTKDKPGKFARDWQHLSAFRAGDTIINYDDGSIYTASFDGVVILPKQNASLNGEWLYLGQDSA